MLILDTVSESGTSIRSVETGKEVFRVVGIGDDWYVSYLGHDLFSNRGVIYKARSFKDAQCFIRELADYLGVRDLFGFIGEYTALEDTDG